MTEGYMDAVKSAVCVHISNADSSLNGTDTETGELIHVIGSWDEDIWNLEYDLLPLVTVRVGPVSMHEAVYGRQLSPKDNKKGTYATFFFTAHVYHTTPTTGDKSTNAMNLAEKIKTYLLKADDSASGIKYYREITLREARINMHNVARVIVEGYIFVRRPH